MVLNSLIAAQPQQVRRVFLGDFCPENAVPDDQRVAVIPITKVPITGMVPAVEVRIIERFVPESLEWFVHIPAQIRMLEAIKYNPHTIAASKTHRVQRLEHHLEDQNGDDGQLHKSTTCMRSPVDASNTSANGGLGGNSTRMEPDGPCNAANSGKVQQQKATKN